MTNSQEQAQSDSFYLPESGLGKETSFGQDNSHVSNFEEPHRSESEEMENLRELAQGI